MTDAAAGTASDPLELDRVGDIDRMRRAGNDGKPC
jgi:hypothetical protein